MTKRLAPTGVGKSASLAEARNYGVSMSGYIWDLSGTDKQCASYGPGHQIHWIHFNHSMREPSVVIPVTASVDDDGLVHIEGDDLSLVRWNHRPAAGASRAGTLRRESGLETPLVPPGGPHRGFHGECAQRIQLGSARRMARLPRIRRADPDRLPPRSDTPARQRHVEKIWAEQEAKNAELHKLDHSHIPPLRIGARYAAGRPRVPRGAYNPTGD